MRSVLGRYGCRARRDKPAERCALHLNHLGNEAPRVLDFFGRRGPPQAESERALCLIVRIAHRCQDVTDFRRAGNASGAGRAGQTRQIEGHHQRRAVQLGDDDREAVSQPFERMPRLLDALDAQQPNRQRIAQGTDPGFGAGAIYPGQLQRGRQTRCPGHILRTGAPIALLRAALLLRQDVRAVAHV